jgi:hypothetical protein
VTTYLNTFRYLDGNLCGPREYTTNAEPQKYRDFLLYHREKTCVDVVKDGLIVAIRDSMHEAMNCVDRFLSGDYVREYHMHEVLILKKKKAA